MQDFLTSLPLSHDELEKSKSGWYYTIAEPNMNTTTIKAGIFQPFSISKAALQNELAKVKTAFFPCSLRSI